MATILLVDDETLVREALAAGLRGAGHGVISAGNEADAKRALAGGRVDAMVVDLDGSASRFDLIASARALAPHRRTHVIALAAKGDRSMVIRAAELGVRDYLLRSAFEFDTFLARLEERLGTSGIGEAKPADAPVARAESAGPAPVGTEAPRVEGEAGETLRRARTAAANGGDPLKSIEVLLTKDQLQRKLDSFGEAKALSPTVAHVLKLANNPNASIESIAGAIKRDHAIALKILKVANSPVYRRGTPVETIDQAAVRIGVGSIRRAVLGIAVLERFGSVELGEFINPRGFWEHALGTGLIASELARAHRKTDPESAFMMGLLHDVGRVVLAEQLPEAYLETMQTARAFELPLHQVEKRVLGMNHADVMEGLLAGWGFPKELAEPITMHHLSLGNVRHLSASRMPEVATVPVANGLAHALLLGDSADRAIYDVSEFMHELDIPEKILSRVESTISSQLADMKLAMLAASNQSSSWVDPATDQARVFDRPIHAMFVSPLAGADPFAMLLSRLATPMDRANVAVMNAPAREDLEPMTRRLHDMEESNGGVALPLVVITAPSKTRPVLPGGRPVRLLHPPLTIATLARALAEVLDEAFGSTPQISAVA